MNIDLAEMYGTPGAEEAVEEREKVAQYELFAKLAADNDINLSELDDEQVSSLWDATFGEEKTAEEKCGDCGKTECSCEGGKDEGGEKTSAAEIEFLQEKDWSEKLAEADFLGRTMAHAYVNELGSIGESMDKEGGRVGDAAKAVREYASSQAGKARESASKASKYIKGKGEGASKYVKDKGKAVGDTTFSEAGRKASGQAKRLSGYTDLKEGIRGARSKNLAPESRAAMRSQAYRGGAKALATGSVIGGGGYAAKNASVADASIDELAFDLAVEKAAESGWNADEAADRINSVFTLGLFDEENTKIASAETGEGAVEIRSLEMLESAGYDVEWG